MSKSLQLAITTIGNLLVDNTITRDSNNNSIENIALKIPNYQRPYKWTAKNVIQLMDDILKAKSENKESYRVGTLILHKTANNYYDIVDGQQRTISFSLLIKALDEKVKNETKNSISFLNQNLNTNPDNKRNVPNNYRTLERRVGNIPEDKDRLDLLDYIKNQCELIVVITEDLSEAFQFFDSQNARGKKLYPHDLLKAYHLREMQNIDVEETEKVVKQWEDMPQGKLSELFSEYLYRLKEWTKGNKSWELNEQNIDKFKGITRQDNFPYAQFYKGSYAYSEMVNQSAMPFVSGTRKFNSFQLDTPIVAGKPFFDYAKHYFEILKDIQNNNKYEGYFINDNHIVKTLDLNHVKYGVGNSITRLLFDTAILLYVDRFCPTDRPSKVDIELLDQFVVFAFIWAYSLRAQYYNLGWLSAQNFVMGNHQIINSFNIYKIIAESDSPISLLSELSDKISPIPSANIKAKKENLEFENGGVFQNYLYFFKINNFIEN